jgi:Mycothiol maleylpyruvate isomerase N-terminal domain
MEFSWGGSRRAFTDAAGWFVRTAALVGDRWEQPGLGDWDVRALVGHASRSLLTVETYLGRPAAAIELPSTLDYFAATRVAAAGIGEAGAGVTQRGVDAGAALGADPAAAVAQIATRVLALVDRCTGEERLMTIAGGMRLRDYLPSRTFELTVHTADLTTALSLPAEVPPTAAAQSLHLVADLAVAADLAAPLLLSATGRPTPPPNLL